MLNVYLRFASSVGVALAVAACTSSSTAPSSSADVTPVAGTTITITSSGASPKNLLVSPGSQVTFVNNDSRAHTMNSDPHPEHTDCPALNNVGFLNPGQSRQTGNLNAARACGYHDHELPSTTSLQATITIR